MSTVDLTIVPAEVTITNVSSKSKTVQGFRTNLTLILPAGYVVKVLAQNSLELAYYYALAKEDEITVTAIPQE